jgi:hypothetical protein
VHPEKGDLSAEEILAYEAIGCILMFCYQSEEGSSRYAYLTGPHLHPCVIAGAMDLSVQEMNWPFDQWDNQTKLKMIKVLLEKQEMYTEDHRKVWQYLSLDPINRTDRVAQELGEQLSMFGTVLFEENLLDENDELDKELVTAENIEKYLWEFLFVKQLPPIQAIAKGMRAACKMDWSAFQKIAVEAVDVKIQGRLNRELIATKIITETHNPSVLKKIEWLKEWIINEATKKEVKDFIKFVTGSTGLLEDQQIRVVAQHEAKGYSLAPYVHTCTHEIQLCPHDIKGEDNSEENFIATIRRTLEHANVYSMA